MLYRSPYIRGHYRNIICEIMAERNISSVQNPGHVVDAGASFTQVVQHTYRYLVDPRNRNPIYRYELYRELLEDIQPSGRREVHIDLGCGAGLFSWVFLDWAKEKGLSFNNTVLFGLDHSVEMINLAHLVRNKLIAEINDYPDLHYTHEVPLLLRDLTSNCCDATDYTITFGHVLAQAHGADDILSFTKVIAHVVSLLDSQSNCFLIAVDARNWQSQFASGWDLLLESLEHSGVGQRTYPVQETHRNDDNRAKFAELYAIG